MSPVAALYDKNSRLLLQLLITMKDTKIGFIGLGNVGSKVAFNILKKKYFTLYVYDLNIKSSEKLVSKGAILCKSLKELVNNVTVFITCLPSPKDVKNVIFNILPFIKKKSSLDRNEYN